MPRFPLVGLLLAALAPAVLAPAARAQADGAPLAVPCVLHTGEAHLHDVRDVVRALRADAMLDAALDARSGASTTTRTTVGAGVTITVRYIGFTDEARDAFEAAVAVWADALASPVPVRVTASFEELGPNVLGSAGPFLVRNFAAAPEVNTWYPRALADALSGEDLHSEGFDIVATFNSAQERFHFDAAVPPPADRFDFASVVLHELGHGLGFVGSATVDDGTAPAECLGFGGQGCIGYFGGSNTGTPVVFDRAIVDAQGVVVTNPFVYPNPSIQLGTFLQSQTVRAGSPAVVAAAGGTGPRLWAPSPFQPGSSISHWHEGDFPAGSPNAAMTPQIAAGESYRSPGRLTCALFADFGWELGPGCAALVPAETSPEAAPALALALAGPNPASARTAVRVRLAAPGPLRVDLLDALGRTVAVLHDGPATDGLTLTVDVRGLAPGVYVARASTQTAAATARVVVAR